MLPSVLNSDPPAAMERKPPPRPDPLPHSQGAQRPRIAPEPPLLTDALDADGIPVLSDVLEPGTPPKPAAPPAERRSNDELRNAAELVFQEVLDEYLPRIEDEIRKRLRERMGNLIRAGKS